ncbi:hydroxyquinol 1,2-dioxygenase [Pararobbsia silviterrae]|uniref:Hydroxyquinol 1,2-dioxygenase n=1 Tax=Pararobbsia silviterrae TaxID=1792498 RepID=A0A494Y3Q6_9BURK|nr:hydroxyquinol 1,2-dioxygenase [Pararobbsia silviterrae]RKP56648.1 hydroxyquinol 1,2-dioxygenase [Pararobbsia silviterrae]
MQQTTFGSLEHFQKGSIEIIKGKAEHYAFSNIYEVASGAPPYQKTVVGKNLKFVIESLRAEGDSPWYAAAHDEFVVVMDGDVTVHYIKPDVAGSLAPADSEGTYTLDGAPQGKSMGYVKLGRGHQAILPAGVAYQFRAAKPGVLIVQTILGPNSVEKWNDICLQ